MMYYTSAKPVSFHQLVETEVDDRGNYTHEQVNHWKKKYKIDDHDMAVWVSPKKWVANSYNLSSDEKEEAKNIPESEMDITGIDSSKGFIIKESDDGDEGYIFVFNRGILASEDDKLQELLKTMNVPELRKKDYGWLLRNISIQNRNNPNLQEALELIKTTMKKASSVKILLAPTWDLAKDVDADVTVEAEYGSNVKKGKKDTLAHHSQEYKGNPPPCTVKPRPLGSGTVLVSHLDLDTIVACLDLMGLGKEVSDKFRSVAGYVDVNGVHKLDDMDNISDEDKDQIHAWWAFSKTLGRETPKEVKDVTGEVKRAGDYISKIMSGDNEAMEGGKKFKKDSEKLESDSFVKAVGEVIIRKSPEFVSHLYRHGGKFYKGVVSLNTKTGAITVALESKIPGTSCKDIVQQLWGPEAGGHDGIAGSPRGKEMSEKELDRAAEALQEAITGKKSAMVISMCLSDNIEKAKILEFWKKAGMEDKENFLKLIQGNDIEGAKQFLNVV